MTRGGTFPAVPMARGVGVSRSATKPATKNTITEMIAYWFEAVAEQTIPTTPARASTWAPKTWINAMVASPLAARAAGRAPGDRGRYGPRKTDMAVVANAEWAKS